MSNISRRTVLASELGAAVTIGTGGVADAEIADLPRVIARMPVGQGPAGVAVNDREALAYVANYNDHTVSVIAEPFGDAKTIKVPGGPADVGVNNVTNRVYVTGYDDGRVTVIDGAMNQVITTVPLKPGLAAVAVNSTTNLVYVTNTDHGTVTVIDGADNRVLTTLPVGENPAGVAVNPVTNRAYVAHGDAVVVILGEDHSFKSIPVGVNLNGIAVSVALDRIYVTDVFPGRLHVIDGVMNQVIGQTSSGNYPLDVGVSEATGRVYVANNGHNALGHNDVTLVDAASLAVLGSVNVGTAVWPQGVAVDSNAGRAFVSLPGNATAAVLGPSV
jgi:YVTN family beta-propeller protein